MGLSFINDICLTLIIAYVFKTALKRNLEKKITN